jgi:hypothetical protein
MPTPATAAITRPRPLPFAAGRIEPDGRVIFNARAFRLLMKPEARFFGVYEHGRGLRMVPLPAELVDVLTLTPRAGSKSGGFAFSKKLAGRCRRNLADRFRLRTEPDGAVILEPLER